MIRFPFIHVYQVILSIFINHFSLKYLLFFQNFQIQKSCKDVFLGNYQIISLSGTLSCNFQPEMKIALADDEVTNRNYAADTVLIISF